jgi:acyl-coenzyme A thioesterase PaaI-like protein
MPPPPRLPLDVRSIWITGEAAAGSRREAKHHLVIEVKRVVELVALLDIEAASTPEPAVAKAIATLRQLADQLETMPSLMARGGAASAGGDDARLMERSGITGRSNPLAPPMHLEFDGSVTRGRAVYNAAYEGPPGCLHGGFVAAAFDDLLGVAQMASGSAGYTGTFTVRMRRPTPLGRRIDYAAGVERVEGRKIWCWGRSYDGEELLAEAEIVFIAPAAGMGPDGAPVVAAG